MISPKPPIRAWMERATLVESIDAPIIRYARAKQVDTLDAVFSPEP